jgi:hypothetical protein
MMVMLFCVTRKVALRKVAHTFYVPHHKHFMENTSTAEGAASQRRKIHEKW